MYEHLKDNLQEGRPPKWYKWVWGWACGPCGSWGGGAFGTWDGVHGHSWWVRQWFCCPSCWRCVGAEAAAASQANRQQQQPLWALL